MAKTNVTTCSNCGANLDVEEGRRIVTCSYCGAKVEVGRPAPPPPPKPAARPAIDLAHIQKATRRSWIAPVIVFAIVGTIAAVSGIGAYLSSRAVAPSVSPLAENAPPQATVPEVRKPPPLPESRRPFPIDVDKDGVEDLVATHSTNWNENIHVVAFDGRDLHELWRSENLGAPAQLGGRPELWMVGRIALTTIGAAMSAFDVGTGRRLWNASFSDKVERLSQAGAAVRVESTDEKRHLVDLATGNVSSDPDKKPVVFHLRNDWVYSRLSNHAYMDLRGGHQWKGLYMDQAYCPEERLSVVSPAGKPLPWTASYKGYCYSDPGVAYAYRDTGSMVPFIVGYDRKKRQIKWQIQLTDPGSILELNEDPKVAFFGDKLLVVYNLRNDAGFFARLMRATDGATLWKTALGKHDYGAISTEAALLTATRAYVRDGYRFMILDAATGAHIATMRD